MKEQYLVVLRVSRPELLTLGPTEDEAVALDAHFAYLNRLADQGIALMFGRTQTQDPDTLGLVVLLANGLDQAWAIVNNDPVVLAGVMTAQVLPYHIAGGSLAPQTVH
jgi:uncharacterized protein YciI